MKNDSDPHCDCAFAAKVLVALTRLEFVMGTVADAWKSVKQELTDLKSRKTPCAAGAGQKPATAG